MVAVEGVLLQPVPDMPHLDRDAAQRCALPARPLLLSVFLQLGQAVRRVGLLGEVLGHDLLLPVQPTLAVRKVKHQLGTDVAVQALLLQQLHLAQVVVLLHRRPIVQPKQRKLTVLLQGRSSC